MTPHWRDPKWQYIPAFTHADPNAFRKRMQEYAEKVKREKEKK